jgi:hypothetical protein
VWLVAAVLLPLQAWCESGNFEITPYGAFSLGGDFLDESSDVEVGLDDSASFGVLMNLRESANTQWELLYSLQGTEADIVDPATMNTSVDIDIHYLQIGGTYQGDGDVARPYLAATLGATRFNVQDAGYDSDTFFSFSIGPGVQLWPDRRFGLRFEARAFGTLVKSGSDLFCVSDPGGGNAGCAIVLEGDILWQFQAIAGVVFRF